MEFHVFKAQAPRCEPLTGLGHDEVKVGTDLSDLSVQNVVRQKYNIASYYKFALHVATQSIQKT